MAIPSDVTGKQNNALIESSSVSGQTGLVVVNPDGSSIGTGGASGGGTVTASGADAVSNTQNAQTTESRLSAYNGTTWDRLRSGVTTVTSTLTGWLNVLPWSVYQSTPATRTNNQGGPLLTDSTGNLSIREQYAPAYEDNTVGVARVEHRYSYLNVTANGTTTVKSGAGLLHTITINTTAATTVVIYDNTTGSGTKIGTLKSSIAEQTLVYDVTFATGLTLVTTATVDITVSYR